MKIVQILVFGTEENDFMENIFREKCFTLLNHFSNHFSVWVGIKAYDSGRSYRY